MAENGLKDTKIKVLTWVTIFMIGTISTLVGAAYASMQGSIGKKADKTEVAALQEEVRLLLILHLNNNNDPTGTLRKKYGERSE